MYSCENGMTEIMIGNCPMNTRQAFAAFAFLTIGTLLMFTDTSPGLLAVYTDEFDVS
jgi:hypothetical protein